MIHPSYLEMIDSVNSTAEGDTPIVKSRYSIVTATAKRARQLIDKGMDGDDENKPLSQAVREIYKGEVKILPTEDEAEEENTAE